MSLRLGITLHDFHGGHGHSHGSGGHGHSHNEKEKVKDAEHGDDWRYEDSGVNTPDSKNSGKSAFSLASLAESTQSQDINVRAAMVHVMGDLLQVDIYILFFISKILLVIYIN